jgi:branched-chain amino acid transport system ATP-binding protein
LAQSENVILRVSEVSASYGSIEALKNASLEVGEGQLVALLGANGAGKSTLVAAIVSTVRVRSGTIWFLGRDITRAKTEDIVASGIAVVPEGRGILPLMTVMENLLLGAYHAKGNTSERLKWLLTEFPILSERRHMPAGMLSGGQQQILAIARALVGSPRLLVLDEPSLGLAPVVVKEVFQIMEDLKKEGQSILLAEQNARKALTIADRVYVLDLGRTVFGGSADELVDDPRLHQAYLGSA